MDYAVYTDHMVFTQAAISYSSHKQSFYPLSRIITFPTGTLIGEF